jgi:hypothetical protein
MRELIVGGELLIHHLTFVLCCTAAILEFQECCLIGRRSRLLSAA